MVADGPGLETLAVGGEQRVLYLEQATEDPDVAAISYAEAQAKLADALQNIKAIRLEQESQRGPEALAAAPAVHAGHPRLALDEFEHTDFTQRPHLMFDGRVTGPIDKAAGERTADLLAALADPTRSADGGGRSRLARPVAHEMNLPDYVAPGAPRLYES